MAIVDADAHVIESDLTWDYMEESQRGLRPMTVHVPGPSGGETEFWLIEGKLIRKGPAAIEEMSPAVRETEDIDVHLRHLDALGTDIKVLFPTIFLRPVASRPEVERALCSSYNRWLVDVWERGKSRLRWAVVLPMMTPEAALEELRFGKEHGACAVFMRGIEGDRPPSHPDFFRLYDEASALNLPICFHAGTGSFAHHDLFPDDPGFWRFKYPGINAFHTLLYHAVPSRFPQLRFGFIELSAQWVPYVLYDLARRFEKQGRAVDRRAMMRANRFYVACQTDDDLAYILTYAGEGNIVMGTDYGHADTSSELEALQRLEKMPGISGSVANKILNDNPRALFCF